MALQRSHAAHRILHELENYLNTNTYLVALIHTTISWEVDWEDRASRLGVPVYEDDTINYEGLSIDYFCITYPIT